MTVLGNLYNFYIHFKAHNDTIRVKIIASWVQKKIALCPFHLNIFYIKISGVDACAERKCDPNSVCTNNGAGYNCQCRQGFTGNGTICTGMIS